MKAGADEKETKEKYFYYVGNVELRKGVDILLDAYRLYREEGGQKNLIVAGGLKDDCLKDNPEKDAILAGEKRFSREDAREIYKDLNFLPSRPTGYIPCICGKACDMVCYKHLKSKGIL